CTQVERSLYCLLKTHRARNAIGAAGTETIENIERADDDRIAAEVFTLIPQLPLDPARVVAALRNSSQGCAYLLSQWTLIKERLLTHCSFEVSQRFQVLYLTGRRPTDLFRDPMVFELDRLYLGAISGPGSFTALEAARGMVNDFPRGEMSEEEFIRRLEPLVRNLPPVEEGHAALLALVEKTIAELTERMELVGLREQRTRYLASVKAGADVSREGEKRERYEAQANRGHESALRTLRQLQDARRKYGESILEDEAEDR